MRSVGGATQAWIFLLALVPVSCRTPDPQAELSISGLETFWAIDPSAGQTNYIAPAVHFRVFNKGKEPLDTVQATAVFRRRGEENQTWGSDWRQLSTRARPLRPGHEIMVAMKSDARYSSTGPIEEMFGNAMFKDAVVQVFLRVGASQWSRFVDQSVERNIGSRSVRLPPQ